MENSIPNINQVSVPGGEQSYYPLGKITLFLLILKRSGTFFALLFLLFVSLFLLNYIPPAYLKDFVAVLFAYFFLISFVLLATYCLGYLEYFRYGIFIGERNLKIKRGLFSTEELGVPYRRIRDVKAKRSITDQIFGVSNLIVVLSDFEEEDTSEESIIFLPSLSQKIAAEIQNSILRRSQVEQINLLGGQKFQ